MSRKKDTWPRRFLIAKKQSDYEISSTRDWPREFADVAGDGRLGEIANDLILDLRCACITASSPYLLASQLEQFMTGWMRSQESTSTAETSIAAVVAKLCNELSNGPTRDLFSVAHLQAIQAACLGIKNLAYTVPDLAAARVSGVAWDTYSDTYAFQVNAWGSQRTAYLSAYSAFEHFLIQCLRLCMKQPSYRYRKEKIEQDLKDNIGEHALGNCWNNRSLQIAREVRHALTHNGGKETSKLRSIAPPHGIEILGADKMLQLYPRDVKAVLSAIEKAATWVVTELADKV